jgi:hypothetical protein
MAAGSSCEITLQTTSVKFLNLTNTIAAEAISGLEGYTSEPGLGHPVHPAGPGRDEGLRALVREGKRHHAEDEPGQHLRSQCVDTDGADGACPTPTPLPAGLVVAPSPRLSTTCPGPGGSGQATITAAPGSNLVTITEAQLDAGSRCTIEVDVLAPARWAPTPT